MIRPCSHLPQGCFSIRTCRSLAGRYRSVNSTLSCYPPPQIHPEEAVCFSESFAIFTHRRNTYLHLVDITRSQTGSRESFPVARLDFIMRYDFLWAGCIQGRYSRLSSDRSGRNIFSRPFGLEKVCDIFSNPTILA